MISTLSRCHHWVHQRPGCFIILFWYKITTIRVERRGHHHGRAQAPTIRKLYRESTSSAFELLFTLRNGFECATSRCAIIPTFTVRTLPFVLLIPTTMPRPLLIVLQRKIIAAPTPIIFYRPPCSISFLPFVAWHRTQNPNWLRSWDKFDRCTVMKTTIRNYLKASLHKSKRELLQQVGRHHHGRAQIFTIGWLIPLAQHVILQAPCTSTLFKQELAMPRSFRQAINSSSDCFDLRGHRPKIIKPARTTDKPINKLRF